LQRLALLSGDLQTVLRISVVAVSDASISLFNFDIDIVLMKYRHIDIDV